MICIGTEILQNYETATRREWLETNGIGGFASSTVIGLNSRRYHGLLTAATRPPSGRVLLLSSLEETLLIGDRAYDLSSNQYVGVVHPQGYAHMEEFRIDPFPLSTFVVDGVRIQKEVFMPYGRNATVIRYCVSGQDDRFVRLQIRPLIAFRDYHGLTRENGALDRTVHLLSNRLVSVHPYPDHGELYFCHDALDVDTQGYWYRNFEYAIERERGLDCVEDLFCPMTLIFDLSRKAEAAVCASTEAIDVGALDTLREEELKRRAQVLTSVPAEDEFTLQLAAAADQYIVNRGHQKTIIAGYPWFTDWGRDTMIALPGLTLASGRPEIAKSILREFSHHVSEGMLPNRFPDGGETPEYNTIDATLWYFEAVRAYLEHTGDLAFVRDELYPVLQDIVEWHVRGTRYGIRVDSDGLVTCDDPSVQLTWMDAKIGDWVVTPRTGKAVEIQALWYNALRTLQAIARNSGKLGDARRYGQLAERASQSFNAQFWNPNGEYLYDVVTGGKADATLRPNQILAVSLRYSMLDAERSRAVVEAVSKDLLTPLGLRSLSPSHADYRGRYEGDPVSRDSAYHQGPVWPWLMGPFIDAFLRVNGRGRKSQQQVRQWLNAFAEHLKDAGLGHVSEIFDGDFPHAPRGCFAQAWSVAEILRVHVESRTARKSVAV